MESYKPVRYSKKVKAAIPGKNVIKKMGVNC